MFSPISKAACAIYAECNPRIQKTIQHGRRKERNVDYKYTYNLFDIGKHL